MVLGGLWHGAAWTFVLWGALHGAFLVVNHLWRRTRPHAIPANASRLSRILDWSLTFGCVCLAWVLFRADSLSTALAFYKGMAGYNGCHASPFAGLKTPFKQSDYYQLFLLAGFVCLALPSSDQLGKWVPWPRRQLRLSKVGPLATGLLTGVTLIYCLSKLSQHSPFLYFQF